jgi:hypothetical protein
MKRREEEILSSLLFLSLEFHFIIATVQGSMASLVIANSKIPEDLFSL